MPTREQIAQQHYRPVPRRQSAQPFTSPRTVAKLPRPVHRQRADDYSDEDEEEEQETTRSMYPVMQRNFQRTPIYYTDSSQPQEHAPPGKKRTYWLFSVGLVVSIMLVGWLLFSMLGSWIQSKMDDFTYGFPRTFQVDQDVGHFGRVSHFLCLNLNGEIEVIETQKGHPEAAKIYVVVVLPQDQARLPVTLSFQDINGDGKLDALVHYGSTEIPLYNNGTTFQSQPPATK